MSPGEWIALMALFVTILVTVVGAAVAAAVYIVREQASQRAKIKKSIEDHEHECAMYEANTQVQLQALAQLKGGPS